MDSSHPIDKTIVLMRSDHTELDARIHIAKEITRLGYRQCKARRVSQERLDRINCIVVLRMHRTSVAKPREQTHRVQGGRQAAYSSCCSTVMRKESR